MSNFPAHLIKPTDSVLCLFGCGRGGNNDIFHLHKLGVKSVTIIEIEPEYIKEVAPKYPGYEFIEADAFEFIKTNKDKYDVVICDPWTDSSEGMVWDKYSEIGKLSRKYIIMGASFERAKLLTGFEKMKRSDYNGGVYWVWENAKNV